MSNVKIKICGLTRPEDCDAVNTAGADFAGFVFAPSRRRVSIKTAAQMKQRLDSRVKTVGVFVNEKPDAISGMCRAGIIDIIQLHGDEDDEYIRVLRSMLSAGGSDGETKDYPVIKSVSVGKVLPKLPQEPDFLLFDTLAETRGGSGKTFDWQLLRGYNGKPYFLSGGLTAQNITDALDILSPYCVDVSSGVETDGAKNAGKIEKFVNAVRQADTQEAKINE